MSSYHFSHNGSPVDKESSAVIEASNSEQESGVVMIRAYPGVRGGKGGELWGRLASLVSLGKELNSRSGVSFVFTGFGALIRAMGMQINKSRSRDACRDLSGRRMRDVNAEKK